MNLDWYNGQKCVALIAPAMEAFSLALSGFPIPQCGTTYTVHDAKACENCGVHISLKEIGERFYYPCRMFRPIEPKEMEVLRGLLNPDPGTKIDNEVKEPEKVS